METRISSALTDYVKTRYNGNTTLSSPRKKKDKEKQNHPGVRMIISYSINTTNQPQQKLRNSKLIASVMLGIWGKYRAHLKQ